MTENWRAYGKCPVCRRVQGERCRDTRCSELVLLDVPHPGRPPAPPLTPSRSSVPVWVDMSLPCACCEALGQSCRACREDAS